MVLSVCKCIVFCSFKRTVLSAFSLQKESNSKWAARAETPSGTTDEEVSIKGIPSDGISPVPWRYASRSYMSELALARESLAKTLLVCINTPAKFSTCTALVGQIALKVFGVNIAESLDTAYGLLVAKSLHKKYFSSVNSYKKAIAYNEIISYSLSGDRYSPFGYDYCLSGIQLCATMSVPIEELPKILDQLKGNPLLWELAKVRFEEGIL